ncbi:MAG TPA: protein kinase [Kofleriaceae bacterium]|nr:protein kinase [Kofleriaceae bacterium]
MTGVPEHSADGADRDRATTVELTPSRPADGASAALRARNPDMAPTLTGASASLFDARRLAPGTAIGHLEIIRSLGQGGMGQVYLARDTRLGRLVAIKQLLGRGNVATGRLLVEAQATARCKHENIVVVYEVGEHQGEPYLVLEYVEGTTLRSWMRAHPPPGSDPAAAWFAARLATALDLVVPIVRALVCAHEQDVVHRDLKPENVLLTHDGRVKVVDFGIAIRLGVEPPRVTRTAAPSAPEPSSSERDRHEGTYLYMAPEQWLAEEIDHRIDLWAVGVLLFELMTGAHPLAPLEQGRLASVADLDAPMPSLLDACPEAGALAPIVDRCLAKHKEGRFDSARELLAALDALRAGRPALADGDNPFPGLSAFQEADAGRFFGRDADVASMTRMLRSQALVAVVGASGAGKSSFVRAGVIPALKRSGERWEAFAVRPGRRPLAVLAEILAQASEAPRPGAAGGEGVAELAATLRAEPGRLGAQLRARCRARAGRLLLFVDQFEELYTLADDAGERATFLACLEGMADDASSPLRVALAVRADFLDRLAEHRSLATDVARGLSMLSPLGRDGLREALVRPVEDAGHRFESDALVEEMLTGLGDARSPLPLLQFAGGRMWEARDRSRRLLSEASYERLGGVAGALASHADAVLDGLPAAEQRLCRAILLRLVTPERTRAVVRVDELRGLEPPGAPAGDLAAVDQVVRRLVDVRLLSQETGGPEGRTLELVHESLIERWPRLGRWLDEGAQDAEFMTRLRAAARQWEAGGEADGLLWREGAAREARAWLERRRAGEVGTAGLSGGEERYLRAVVALGERARRRRRWAVTGLVAGLTAFAVAGSLLAVRARDGEARARAEAMKARNAARMAAAREKQADPATVLAIVRELEPPDLPHGWAALADGALRGSVARVVITLPSEAWSVAWSPDGRSFATASIDGAVRVFRADGAGEPLVLRARGGPANSVAFSPDGQRIASAWADRAVRVFRADGEGAVLVLRGHEDNVPAVAFSPDGRRIASASSDGTVRVWSADGAGAPLVLRGHQDAVLSVAWSADGRRIASGSADRTVRVWNADGAGAPLVLRGPRRAVTGVAWSPDGERIAGSAFEVAIQVWRADGTGGEPATLRGHEAGINGVDWNRDGQRIVGASNDRTARIFRADGTGEPLVLSGNEGGVLSAVFSPDGTQVLTSSMDRTVRVYRADGAWEPLKLRGHEELVSEVAFSPDGRRIATASMDGTARIWNADGTGEPVVLRGHSDFVIATAFSPDGRRVATASVDRTMRLWDAASGAEVAVFRGHESDVLALAFSPDGRHIATGSADRSVRIWSADGTGEPRILRGHDARVTAVDYSPDGRRIVTASADTTARVWDAARDGRPLVVLRGHDDIVMSAAFSPDGRRIATGSADKTARIWDADGRRPPLVLRGHQHIVSGVAWSPDGERVATASADQTIRLWRTDGTGEELALRANGVASDVAFSPDGKRLAGAVATKVWIWTDLDPLRGVDAPALWSATSYCLPVERRVALLNVSEAHAWTGEQACRRRVAAARKAEPARRARPAPH